MKRLTVRKFPAVFGIITGVFLRVLSIYKDNSVILSGIAALMITGSVYLLIITLCDILNRAESKKEPEIETPEERETNELPPPAVSSDGLIEIPKDVNRVRGSDELKQAVSGYKSVLSLLYVTALVLWGIFRILLNIPQAYVDTYPYSTLDAVLLLVFAFVSLIYLKIRKDDGTRPADITSHGICTILSFISFVNAAVIAATALYGIDIFTVMLWMNKAAEAYLIIALSAGAATSAMKDGVLNDLDYKLIPDLRKTATKTDETVSNVLYSKEVKEKFSLKSLWTIRYILRIFPGLILSACFAVLLSTCFYSVNAYENAVIYRFGKLSETVAGPGFHVKLPFPVDLVQILDTQWVGFHTIQIGYHSTYSADNLWNQERDKEYALLLGNGAELVSVDMKIVCKISDLRAYLTYSAGAETDEEGATASKSILSAMAYEALMRRTAVTTLDTMLSIDRNSLSQTIMDELTHFCESEDIGLTVTSVIIESIHPLAEISSAYQGVASASTDKDTLITKAHTTAAKQIIEAQKESKIAIDNAYASRYRRFSDAQQEMAIYYAAMEAYAQNPESFILTKYLKTYEKVISGNKVYVFSPGTQADIPNFVFDNNAAVYPLKTGGN